MAKTAATLEGAGKEAPGQAQGDSRERDINRILEERAQRLARPSQEGEPEPGLDIAEFSLGRERYGLELVWIREVHFLQSLTSLPGTPGFVVGITSLRGQIISILDLAVLFDLPGRELSDSTKYIILSSREMEFAVLAEAVLGVKTVPISALQPSIATFNGVRGKYLKGVTPEGLILLDGRTLLSDPGLVVHDQP